jgi:pimeloyl-ACP methyl ester carboxylesterase
MLKTMPEDHFVVIDNLSTRYWSVGDRGPTIVLVHGLAAAADVWMYNIEALAREHHVIVTDLPGFGKSDIPPSSFGPADYSAFLARLIDKVTDNPVILAGQSLGGAIVLDYAIRHPEKVDGLVLVDSAGFGKEVVWTLRLLSLPFLGELVSYPTRKGVEIFFRLAIRNPAVVTKEFVEVFYHHYRRPGFRKFFLRLLRQLMDIRGARSEHFTRIIANMHQITKPVLIVWGEEDHVLPLKHAYVAKNNLPHAALKTIKGCGHLPFLECADEFNSLVLDFLNEERPLTATQKALNAKQ